MVKRTLTMSLCWLTIIAVVASCGPNPELVSDDDTTTEITPEPDLSRYNTDFDSLEKISAWQDQVHQQIDIYVEADQNLRQIFDELDQAPFNQRALNQMVENGRENCYGEDETRINFWLNQKPELTDQCRQDRFGDYQAPIPSRAEAVRLEESDSEYQAGKVYLELEDLDSARRCARALAQEGEWQVSANLSIGTGDEELVFKAVDILIDGGQLSRVRAVMQEALITGNGQLAGEIAGQYNLDLINDRTQGVIRQLAEAGDTILLKGLIEQRLAENAFASRPDEHRHFHLNRFMVGVVADIVTLGEHDQEAARKYATTYLNWSEANVFSGIRCPDGCGTVPVPGSVALYQLVRGDSTLKQRYLDLIGPSLETVYCGGDYGSCAQRKEWGDECWFDAEGGDFALWAMLAAVRQVGDKDLKQAWETQINRLFANCCYLRSFSLFVLKGTRPENDCGSHMICKLMNGQCRMADEYETAISKDIYQPWNYISAHHETMRYMKHSPELEPDFHNRFNAVSNENSSALSELGKLLQSPYWVAGRNLEFNGQCPVTPCANSDSDQMMRPLLAELEEKAPLHYARLISDHPDLVNE